MFIFYVVGDYSLVECFNRIGLSLCVYVCSFGFI